MLFNPIQIPCHSLYGCFFHSLLTHKNLVYITLDRSFSYATLPHGCQNKESIMAVGAFAWGVHMNEGICYPTIGKLQCSSSKLK